MVTASAKDDIAFKLLLPGGLHEINSK